MTIYVPVIFVVVLIIAMVLTSYYGEWLEKRHYVYTVIAVVALSVYVVSLTEGHLTAETDAEFWKALGFYLGPLLVVVGWVVTNEVNILNARKQHTLSLILQYFTNPTRIEDKAKIGRTLPNKTKIDPAQFDFEDHNHPFMKTIERELNYLDFLASAILRREVEENLLRRVLRDVIGNHYTRLEPYISYCQKKNADTWADFVALHERWK